MSSTKKSKTRFEAKFFARDTITVARELLGALIVRRIGAHLMQARIVETEAYTGDDPACHAYANTRRVSEGKAPIGRSALLFGDPGQAYVYFNYGMYYLFNVVTEPKGIAGAVLVRGVEPILGVEFMQQRRPKVKRAEDLTNGPGKLCLAMAIGPEFNGINLLTHKELYLEPAKENSFARDPIVSDTRIGISKAQEHLWRFYLKGNPYVSKVSR